MIKMFIIYSTVFLISACSQGSRDTGNEFDAGYDAGYIKGYASGHDQKQDPDANRETDSINEPESNYGIKPDSIGNNKNDTSGSLPGVFPDYDIHSPADTDSVYIQEENQRIPDERDLMKKQEPAVIINSGQEEKSGIFTTGLSLYIVIIILLLTLIILQLLSLRRKSMEIYGHTKILKDIAKSQRITKNIDIISNRLTRIESEIIKISESRQVENDQNTDNPVQELITFKDKADVITSDESDTDDPKNTPVTFFMPSPDNDGNFDNRKKSDHFIPSESIYKFIMNENSDKTAEFYIYQDQNNMERAINYYSSILEKVCKSENSFNPMGKSIVTLEPGIAVLTGNKWVVKEKALVKYE